MPNRIRKQKHHEFLFSRIIQLYVNIRKSHLLVQNIQVFSCVQNNVNMTHICVQMDVMNEITKKKS